MPATARTRLAQTTLFAAAWLVGLEILTRTFLVSPTNIVPDPMVGYLNAPNSTALIETPDAGFQLVQFNELGFNDWPLAPGDKRPRILVLGDSYVESFQLPRSENFLSLLGCVRPDLRFVNGGRSGLDPVTEYLMLEKLAPAVRPTGVILVVNDGDEADLLSDGLQIRRCGHEICGYSMPAIAVPHRAGMVGVFSGRSGLLTYLVRRFQPSLRAGLPRFAALLPKFAAASARSNSGAADSYAARDFEPLLTLVFRRIAAHYPLLVVAIPTMTFRPHGKTNTSDGGRFEEIVMRAAARAGADAFDTAPALADAYARTGQPPRGFDFNRPGAGHLNAAGHAAVAHGIEKHLNIYAQKLAG